mmetsp:Transcript_19199/g.38930  ORF Transcript_19199/g.38930 Transcript_19199/m.38930 type:complete len:216 (-) Transcript_19199:24-671(-)
MKASRHDQCRQHGRCQSPLDRLESLVEREEGPTAPRDGPAEYGTKDGDGEHAGGYFCRGGRSQADHDPTPERLEQNDEGRLQQVRKFENLPQDRKVQVYPERREHREDERVVRERDREAVEQYRDDDPAAHARHDVADEFERRRARGGQAAEDLVPVKHGISEHAHVSDRWSAHQQERGDGVVEDPSGWVLRWGRGRSIGGHRRCVRFCLRFWGN